MLTGGNDNGYMTQAVLKFGKDDALTCSEGENYLLPFISADLLISQPDTRLYALKESTSRFMSATVVEVNKANESFNVLFDGSTNTAVVKQKDTSVMPSQPLRGKYVNFSINNIHEKFS